MVENLGCVREDIANHPPELGKNGPDGSGGSGKELINGLFHAASPVDEVNNLSFIKKTSRILYASTLLSQMRKRETTLPCLSNAHSTALRESVKNSLTLT